MNGVIRAAFAGTQGNAVTLPVMLVIGDLSSWRRAGNFPPAISGFHWANLHDLSVELLEEISPDVILTPLFSPHYDAMDLAGRLQELGFQGRLRALAADLPNKKMVSREISASAPAIDFDIFAVDESGVNVLPRRRVPPPTR